VPRTRIKICGIRDEAALLAAAKAGADAVGFNFVPESPRYIDPDEAFGMCGLLPPFVATVGVVADPTPDSFADLEEACPTTHTQMHGKENERIAKACGPDIIKAVRFDPATIATELARWDRCEDVFAVLVDGASGGSGVAFDWSLLVPHLAAVTKPIILAGGLNPMNVGEAIRAVRPYAVDVASGVERERGVKDPDLIAAFCEAVRRADGG